MGKVGCPNLSGLQAFRNRTDRFSATWSHKNDVSSLRPAYERTCRPRKFGTAAAVFCDRLWANRITNQGLRVPLMVSLSEKTFKGGQGFVADMVFDTFGVRAGH